MAGRSKASIVGSGPGVSCCSCASGSGSDCAIAGAVLAIRHALAATVTTQRVNCRIRRPVTESPSNRTGRTLSSARLPSQWFDRVIVSWSQQARRTSPILGDVGEQGRLLLSRSPAFTSWSDPLVNRWGVEPICRVLQFAPSTFNAAKSPPPSARTLRDERLKVRIAEVFDPNYRVYGADKVWAKLNREGTQVARCTVERSCETSACEGRCRGKTWTRSHHRRRLDRSRLTSSIAASGPGSQPALGWPTSSVMRISRAFVEGEPVGNLTRTTSRCTGSQEPVLRRPRWYWELRTVPGRCPCGRPGSSAGLGSGRLHDLPRRDLGCPAHLGRDGLLRSRLLQRGQLRRPLPRLGGAAALCHRGAGCIPLIALLLALRAERSSLRGGLGTDVDEGEVLEAAPGIEPGFRALQYQFPNQRTPGQ